MSAEGFGTHYHGNEETGSGLGLHVDEGPECFSAGAQCLIESSTFFDSGLEDGQRH